MTAKIGHRPRQALKPNDKFFDRIILLTFVSKIVKSVIVARKILINIILNHLPISIKLLLFIVVRY